MTGLDSALGEQKKQKNKGSGIYINKSPNLKFCSMIAVSRCQAGTIKRLL